MRWHDEDVSDQVRRAADRFVDECAGAPWSVAWCAGAGVSGATGEQLMAETETLAALLDALPADGMGRFFLSSSAGGIYAGSGDLPITEESLASPLSGGAYGYGENKLRQETLVGEWVASTGNAAAVGRIANLYGPGQSLTKGQGLITTVAYLTLLRRPVPVFVSLDTLRDYIYSGDCARLAVEMLQSDRMLPGTMTTKILCSGTTRSVGEVLAEVGRVVGRTPGFAQGATSASRLQGRALRFRSTVWSDLDDIAFTPLPHGIDCIVGHLRREIGRARLV